MRYYLDTEFDGLGGRLISLALVRDDGDSFYYDARLHAVGDSWVRANVLPLVACVPDHVVIHTDEWRGAGDLIERFLHGDEDPVIVTDWPDDIRYFCELVVTGPGTMIDVPGLRFEMHRVDAYPTDLPGAIQHNAWWDAMALREKLRGPQKTA